MDVFGTVRNGIELAKDIHGILSGIRHAPDTLQQLNNQVHDMEMMLNGFSPLIHTSSDSESQQIIHPLFSNTTALLDSIKQATLPFQKVLGEKSPILTWTAIRIYMSENKISKFRTQLKYHLNVLNLLFSYVPPIVALSFVHQGPLKYPLLTPC
jgi:hypothetical protein